jgi:hypothetical protein
MLSDEVLLAVKLIRQKYEYYGETKNLHNNTAVKDIRILLEIIDNLDKD